MQGNAVVGLAGLPAPGRRRARGDSSGSGRWSWSRDDSRSRSTSPSSPRAAGSSRSGSGEELQEPERPAAGAARRRGGAALDPRPAARRRQRAEVPRLRVPRGPRVRPADHRHAETIGQRLAREGVLGRFAVDFVVVRDADGEWAPYAIEINLRKGGTTHPFLTLQFLTDGRYDPATALFITPRGHEKHLVATDHLESASCAGSPRGSVRHRGPPRPALRPVASGRHRLPHDSCLTELGRVGMTAVGDTPAEADVGTAKPSGSCWTRPGCRWRNARYRSRRRLVSHQETSGPSASTSSRPRSVGS